MKNLGRWAALVASLAVGAWGRPAVAAEPTAAEAAAGALAALFTAWVTSSKADVWSMLNGVLAGLVAITASCAFVKPWAAVIVGAVAGVLMVFAVRWTERVLKVDDPVGAFSVHGISGIWGTLSTGLFAAPDLVDQVGMGQPGLLYGAGLHQLGVQALGVTVSLAYVLAAAWLTFVLVDKAVCLRLSRQDERIGLDISEHGLPAYAELLPSAEPGISAPAQRATRPTSAQPTVQT